MSEIYIFSQDDELLTILTEATGLISAPFRDEKNSVSDETFVFTVDADVERAKHVKEENRVVFKDKDGFFREMVIKELDDIDNNEGPQTMATCLPAWLDELSENYVLDKRYTDKEAQLALNDALAGTRYIGEVEVSLGLASTNFYRLSSVDSIWKIISVWGGEFKDVVEFTGNKITTRKILLLQRLGADNGARFEIDHNIEEIQRTVLSYPKTAMYGWGASLETEGGGHTRYIDFADVVLSKAKGDPVDKPKGQKWVGDPDALLKYGRKHDGQLLHRFSEFSNQDYEDPEELLWATWNNLQDNKEPVVNYKLSVDLLDKDVSLGDGAVAIDRQFARPIEIQTRVIAIEYDLLDIEGTAVVEMGQFLNLGDDDIYRDIEDLKNEVTKPRPTKPITDESFPDIVPGIPVNIVTDAAMGAIQLYWEYDSEVYISHYEVYGSQVADFVPDSQHLLWRGRVSTFVHTVGTDQTWYYYLRAVNTRGTASSFSQRVSASTYRVMSDDILFGELIADHFKDGLDIADKLTQNTIDRINEGPMQEIVYTQQEIAATEDRLLSQLNSEIGDVNASISSLLDRTKGIEGTITSINQEVDDIEGKLLTTITQLTNLDGVVSAQETTLQQHAGLISAKAEKSEVYTRADVNTKLGSKIDTTVYNNKMGQLDVSISGISGRVSNTEATVNGLTGDVSSALSQVASLDVRADQVDIRVSEVRADFDNLKIGGTNLLRNGSFEEDLEGWTHTSNVVTVTTITSRVNSGKKAVSISQSGGTTNNFPGLWQAVDNIKENATYTFSFWYNSLGDSVNDLGFFARITHFNSSGVQIGYIDLNVEKVQPYIYRRSHITFKTPMGTVRSNFRINYRRNGTGSIDNVQLEEGNIVTSWSPAPEDTDARFTSAEGSISTLAGQVELKASQTSVDSIAGRMDSAESRINVLPNEIDLRVTNGINALEIGGTNLISGSATPYTLAATVNNSNYYIIYRGLEKNATYTFSSNVEVLAGNVTEVTVYPYLVSGTSMPNSNHPEIINGKIVTTFKTDSRANYNLLVYAGRSGQTAGNSIRLSNYKLEKGTKATDWSPAPEDQVSNNRILASINLSTEGVRIDGKQIHLTGQTLIDDAVIGTAAMANLSVTNAKLGLLSVGTAQMQNLSVVNGKIGNLAVDDAKIANISVSKLKAGEMDTSKITIRGGSSIDYMLIDGSRLESRGRYNMRWHNKSKTIDASLYLANGNFRVANWTDSRSIFMTPFGLSTFADGYGDGTSSGMLEFFSEEFESTTHGITLASQLGIAGIKSFKNRVFVDAYTSANIESRQAALYFRPYKDLRPGNNTFAMTVVDESNSAATDGILFYGSDVGGYGAGLRFSKAESNMTVAVTDGNGARGGNATLDAGIVRANRITKRDGSQDVYFNGSGGGTLLYGNNPFIADGVRSSSSALYLGVDDEVRVTNGAGYNNGNTVIYRPIKAIEFRTSSSIQYKTNIEDLKESALAVINRLHIVEYDLKDDLANGVYDNRQVGFIAEHNREIATSDLSSVNLYKVTSLNTRALQEVDTKVYNIDKKVSIHDLKIQFLEQRLDQEIGKRKELEHKVQQLEGVA
ncbi:phage tail spike protein [Bacillus sp. FSL K6-3431]|uniref:phage tail spike protein n=1 Tax=Bacillus sp. FSL K6-3431 TaxID=2921500 RepID=UPI0030F75A70